MRDYPGYQSLSFSFLRESVSQGKHIQAFDKIAVQRQKLCQLEIMISDWLEFYIKWLESFNEGNP